MTQNQERKVELLIVSSSGDLEDEFSENMKIQAVKQRAIAQLNIDESKAKQYQLVHEGDPLPENKTLDELGIEDGAELILEPEPEVI